MVCAGLGGPALDLWSLDFNGAAAVATDQVVVMVTGGAAAIANFTIVAAKGVEFPGISEGADLVVHGGKGDVHALCLEFGMEFLG